MISLTHPQRTVKSALQYGRCPHCAFSYHVVYTWAFRCINCDTLIEVVFDKFEVN